jgi:hypothetical protein
MMLPIALCLPAPDVEALIQGRMIAVMARLFLNPGRQFALYPADALANSLSLEQYYRSGFLPTAQTAQSQLTAETVLIKAWAKCELCQMVNKPELLEALSQLTVWTTEALEQILQQQPHIFLAYLRVYRLNQPVAVPVNPDSQHTIGKFVGLPVSLNIAEAVPVLSDRIFTQRRQKLEKLEPPDHPQLEELQGVIAQFAATNPVAKQLDQDIKQFLWWSQGTPITQSDPDLKDWICNIADVGNSSDGYTFEKLVRKSFIKLGFSNSNPNLKDSLDPEKVGGAGGLDFYCEAPYPVVGECKASKSETVPDGTPAQLVKLGYKHLKRQYNRCIKIIMAAGKLTEDAELTANGNEMNVLRPETLQRLVELKAKHPGSINLLELKPCLEQEPFGEEADRKVNDYINNVWQDIKLRSHLVEIIKKANREIGIEYLSGAYDASSPPKPIFNLEGMYKIMIELSSPLTGYLGRKEGSDWRSDRFYYLRDLQVD